MKPNTLEKLIAVAGTAAGCASLVAGAAYVLGNPLAAAAGAAAIIMTAVCAGCLAGIHIGRNMTFVEAELAPTWVEPTPPRAPRLIPVPQKRHVPLQTTSGAFEPLDTGTLEMTDKERETLRMLPIVSGTFEMTDQQIALLKTLCAPPPEASVPTVEIDTTELQNLDYRTVPMRVSQGEEGYSLQLVEW